MVTERLLYCNDEVVLETMFLRLWSVAMQRDRATIYSQRRQAAHRETATMLGPESL